MLWISGKGSAVPTQVILAQADSLKGPDFLTFLRSSGQNYLKKNQIEEEEKKKTKKRSTCEHLDVSPLFWSITHSRGIQTTPKKVKEQANDGQTQKQQLKTEYTSKQLHMHTLQGGVVQMHKHTHTEHDQQDDPG